MILDYISDKSKSESDGWWLLGLLAFMLFLRLAFFTLNFNVGLQSAIRLTGALQYLGFSKLLRLSNVNEKVLGQLVTCCTGDQERIAESVIISVLFFGKFRTRTSAIDCVACFLEQPFFVKFLFHHFS